MRYWQDLEPGQKFATHSATISKQDILEFAAEFDPQPYHLDNASADDSIFGGLCASGWQVCAILNRLVSESLGAEGIAFVGTQSIPEQRWRVPVFADTSISASLLITECNEHSGEENLGSIACDIELINQDQVKVLSQKAIFLIAHSETESDTEATQGGNS